MYERNAERRRVAVVFDDRVISTDLLLSQRRSAADEVCLRDFITWYTETGVTVTVAVAAAVTVQFWHKLFKVGQ